MTKIDSKTRSLLRDVRAQLVKDRQAEVDAFEPLPRGRLVIKGNDHASREGRSEIIAFDRLIARVDLTLGRKPRRPQTYRKVLP